MKTEAQDEKLISFSDLQKVIPLGRTKLYELMKIGKLSKPVKIGMRSFWKHSEIQIFLKELTNN